MSVTESAEKNKRRDQMSPSQLKKDIAKETFSAPQFVYPIAVGTGMVVTAWALGMGGIGFSLVALGLGAIAGSGGWATLRQAFWNDRLIYERMVFLQKRMREEIEAKRSALKHDLGSLSNQRGSEQLENLTAKFDLVIKRLGERFDPNEMTFVRYVGTAEQVYLGALDNLRVVVEANELLDTIDVENLSKRRDELVGNEDDQESKHLQDRIDMHERYCKRIQESLSMNEAALTRLSQVLEALIQLNTGQGMAKAPLDKAMTELSRLAETTNEYGI